ncbi:MAG: hypothetical protein M0T84_02705 [Betaproteobacteria bacterium]|nr:hypothetical protein [Betaproteobacteria bacterium]
MRRAARESVAMTAPRRKFGKVLLTGQPMLYVCLLLVAISASYIYEARTRTIFACQARGYTPDRYLAYCHGASYADYEHGAFLFDLEPSARDFARKADVLFLGNSRMEIGLSTAATSNWFSSASASYYLMGFGYNENEAFEGKLLRTIQPQAKVYVINVDDFFVSTETAPAKAVFHNPEARSQYERKKSWQNIHESICGRFAGFCGNKYTIFRSRRTGAYYPQSRESVAAVTPVSYDDAVQPEVVDRQAAAATAFLSRFAAGKCVILMVTPYVRTQLGNARAIAERLGKTLVTVGNVGGLRTFDGSHLDQPSAARWSQAFLQAAGPEIRSCLRKQGAAPS